MDAYPRDIPGNYKINYLDFVEKLNKFGWESAGGSFDNGHFFRFYRKNDYIIEIMIDGFEGKPPYDYSKSKIYKISIEKINDIKNKN